MTLNKDESIVEYDDLVIRINKINHYIYSEEFKKLSMSQQKQIIKQEIHMSEYKKILKDRMHGLY